MKKLILITAAIISPLIGYSQGSYNVDLLSNKDEHNAGGTPAGWHYASVWGYTHPNGREYAIIGYYNGTSVYDITNAPTVVEKGTIPGPGSYYNYREFTVAGNYLYIVTEGTGANQGLQIVNLSYLPDSIHFVQNWTFSTFTHAHTIKSSGNYLYLNGANYNSGGLVVLDISNPEAPIKRGDGPALYVHDCFIKNDTVYAANVYSPSQMSIINATNKDAPTLITQFVYPNAVCHNVWTSNDRRFLLTTDEGGSNHLKIWNSQNLNNITLVYEYIPYELAMVHNAYFKNNLIFMAHYRAGVIVLDCTNLPAAPTLKGYYDTYPGVGTAYQGAWNVYPYYNSGKFVVSDIATGLYVFQFHDATGITSNGNEIPSSYKLGQNYPNPFNPSTNIGFEIPDAGNISLTVYDASGKQIECLYNGYQFAGKYLAKFDASKLSSGVYYYSLRVANFSDTKKMVVVK